jgi:hypothetical protein
MVRTEQPLFIIGGKAALVRGDAHGTTDPMSAHGAKVAIESALADQFYLKMTERPGNETLAQILFTDMAEAFLAKSQAEGFYMRAKFHEHTEAYQYFMELGRASGWATQHEVGQLAALFDRGQFALEDRDFAKLSPVEGEFLMNLREKIYSRAQLFELPESYKQDPILATLVKDLKHPILTISPAEELEAKKMASELLFKPDLKDLGIALGLLLIIDSTARRLKSSQ